MSKQTIPPLRSSHPPPKSAGPQPSATASEDDEQDRRPSGEPKYPFRFGVSGLFWTAAAMVLAMWFAWIIWAGKLPAVATAFDEKMQAWIVQHRTEELTRVV